MATILMVAESGKEVLHTPPPFLTSTHGLKQSLEEEDDEGKRRRKKKKMKKKMKRNKKKLDVVYGVQNKNGINDSSLFADFFQIYMLTSDSQTFFSVSPQPKSSASPETLLSQLTLMPPFC